MKNRSIKQLLMINGICAVSLIVTLGCVGLYAKSELVTIIDSVEGNGQTLRYHMDSDMMHDGLLASVTSVRLAVKENKLDKLPELQTEIQERSARLMKDVKMATQAAPTPEILAQFKQIASVAENYTSGAQLIVATALKDPVQVDEKMPVFQAGFKSLEGSLARVGDMILEQSKKSKDESGSIILRVNVLITASVVLAIGVIAFFGSRIANAVTQPVDELIRTIERVASQSDLTARADIQHSNELGHAMRSFNSLLDTFQTIVSDVRTTGASLSSNSQALEQMASKTLGTSQGHEDAGNLATRVMGELSNSIASMMVLVDSANTASQNSLTVSREGEALVGESSSQMEEILSSVTNSASNVGALENRVTEIAQITSVIRSIAEQTNLLALNAAIEAARAGEGGRGFAVVADEVRRLAERTSQATTQINQMIESIQMGTKEATNSMCLGVEKVHSGVELTKQVGASILKAASEAGSASSVVSQISEGLEEHSHTISATVVQVSDISHKGREIAKETARRAQLLAEMAALLDTKVARFQL